jgi:hypothetical protein
MKTLLLAILLAPLSLVGQTACETNITKGLGGGLFLTLQPGVAQTVSWDFSTCWFGIQNFTIYITKPRACPSCTQHTLPPSTPLALLASNLSTGAFTTCPGFTCPMGTVSGDQIELNLMLDAKAKKPLEIEISTTAALGGP